MRVLKPILISYLILCFVPLSFGETVDEAISASENGDFALATKILGELNASDHYVMYAWGVAYRNGGAKVEPNYKVAVDWFKKAANEGSMEAQYTLALMYQHGDNVPFDANKSIQYYESASSQGYMYATFNLALRYYHGDLVKADFKKAFSLFLKVAENGFPQGERMVGLMYLKGECVEKNIIQARSWFYKAAIKGLPSAQNNMANLWYGQEGHPVDLVKSYAWFTLAFQNGHPETDANYRAIIKPKLTKIQLKEAEDLVNDLTKPST